MDDRDRLAIATAMLERAGELEGRAQSAFRLGRVKGDPVLEAGESLCAALLHTRIAVEHLIDHLRAGQPAREGG